jgi:hypothetical protein
MNKLIFFFLIIPLICNSQYKRDYYYTGDLLIISGIVFTTTSFFSTEKLRIDGKINYREQIFYAGLAFIGSGFAFNAYNSKRISLDIGSQIKLTYNLDGLVRKRRRYLPEYTVDYRGSGSRHGRLSEY